MLGFRSNIAVGYGKSHASFGEIVQGRRSDGKDLLVTLPIDMWSICNLTAIERRGPLVINCEFSKSKKVAKMLLDKLGVAKGYEITISFSRNIPIGKGLSSSTADMLSTVRALQEIFGFLLREKTISEIFTEIEPHDGLMYKSCVMYDHRKGELIKELLYIPQYWVIALDVGGEVSTVEYNDKLDFTPAILKRYDGLIEEMEAAFAEKDDERIAKIATGSTELHQQMVQDEVKQRIISGVGKFQPMGIVNTHSGTCLGLLFPKSMSLQQIDDIAVKVNEHFDLPVFVTSTLKLLI